MAGAWRTVPFVLRFSLVVLIAAVFSPGCGKKGPPLPPVVKAPARPDPFVARRLGATVYVQVKIPTTNGDGTSPADIERVDVYGFTGIPDGNEGILKYGTVVASVPVRKPPKEAEADHTKKGVKPEAVPPPPPRPPSSWENGFDQGDTVVVSEPLGPAQYQEVLPKKKKEKKIEKPKLPEKVRDLPLGPAPLPTLPARLYIAVGINHKGQKGAVSGRQSVLLVPVASAPSDAEVTYNETSFTVSWKPSADAYPSVGGGGADDVLKSTPIGTIAINGAYNVYEVPPPIVAPPGTVAPMPPAAGGKGPAPVNAKPIPASPFVDKRMEFGKQRCYAVRTVTLYGPQSIESEAPAERCVTPVDTFAPSAPASLKAVGSEGAVSLIWDANREDDLAGYLVLRATLPGTDFVPVTPQPITEAAFSDTTAKSGARYAYVVLAVDKAGNRSARSNQVEEAAR
jgi:hypothetical protein